VSTPAATAPAPFIWVGARLERVRARILAIRTAYVLALLCGVQGLAVLALALTVRHNGWLYYAGGDQLWHYSGAYLLAHGHLPPALVGYGWSVLLIPVAAVAGPNLVAGLPAMVLFNTLVLLPVALLCIYGIASRIAGRLFGYFAAALWIAVPYLGILFVEPGYHQKYTEVTLPQALGLTSVPDFPSTVGLLVSAYFCLRAAEGASWQAAAGAGLAAGYAIAIKPSNAIFLVVPFLTLVFTKWRALLPFALALTPALLTLLIWKYRGLGELAATPSEPARVALGPASLFDRIHNPQLNNFDHLRAVMAGLREHFWIARVLEWAPLAGAIALLLRSRRAFLLLASWFGVYFLVKGSYVLASLDDASFFRLLMPSFPAFVLLAASIVLLVPGVRPQPAPLGSAIPARRLTVAFAVAAALFVLLPLGVIVAAPPLHDQGQLALQSNQNLVPVRGDVGLTGGVQGRAVQLSWQRSPTRSATVFYRVLRSGKDLPDFACGGRLNNAADRCTLYMNAVAATEKPLAVDHPGPGTWTYRVAVAANWLNDFHLGDDYVLSRPVTVTVH
jgi:hypothetical protein